MKGLPKISAVILDLDGLILDTESSYFLAWQAALKDMGFSFPKAQFYGLSGMHYQHVIKEVQSWCGSQFNTDTFNTLSARFWHQHVQQQGIAKKQGADTLISWLQATSMPYCLATNSRTKNALECLDFASMKDTFPNIVTRDDVQHGKPDPELFLQAAQLLNVDIKQCLIAEDSHTGIQAAYRSGGYSVLVPSIKPVEEKSVKLASQVVADLDELTRLLKMHKCGVFPV